MQASESTCRRQERLYPDGGSLVYHPDRSAACVAATRRRLATERLGKCQVGFNPVMSTGVPAGGLFECVNGRARVVQSENDACEDVITGPVATGDACENWEACATGYCDYAGPSRFQCWPSRVADGEACERFGITATCGDFHMCGSSGPDTCTAAPGPGDGCNLDHQDCSWACGQSCVPDADGGAHCVPVAMEGGLCGPPACARDLACVDSVCVALAGAGEECNGNAREDPADPVTLRGC